MKKVLIIIALIIILPIAYYLISPIFNVVELNEGLPGSTLAATYQMDAEKKAEFEEQMEKMKGVVMTSDEKMPPALKILAKGDFVPGAHEVRGRALLLEAREGTKIVRFEDFETINGPDLHIYLSSELGDTDFIELGKIKATKGDINYEIPESIDTNKYNKVLVWCKPFGVLFSYSILS